MRRLVGISVVIVGLLTAASAQAAKTAGVAWAPGGSFDYGTLDAADGGNASQTFTLRNTDGKPTGALSISLTGSGAFTKTADTCTGTKLSSKRTCSVTVKYAPSANGSDNATLSASAPNTSGASDSLSGASAWQNGDLTTYQQTEWGDTPNGTNPASLLNNNYDSVYSATGGVFEIGISGSGGFSIQFTNASNLLAYLPASGTIGALDADYIDPPSTPSGGFGGEITGLKLNIDFSDAGLVSGNTGLKFGDLRLCNIPSPSSLDGSTVRGFLGLVDTLLGGGSNGYAITDLDPITADLNAAFVDGTTASTWAQQHLQPGSCP
jgi:hypothetical protein